MVPDPDSPDPRNLKEENEILQAKLRNVIERKNEPTFICFLINLCA